MELPCGKCIGCRLDKAREWQIRCVQEAQLHNENCFITLTYSEPNLPYSGSLRLRDFQLFLKRLREQYSEKKIRFFHCGEYGEKLTRPHYHALLFGHDFEDKKPWKKGKTPDQHLYRSASLEKLWPLGHSSIGDLNKQSAGYVARYCLKKQTGENAENHYQRVDADGVIHQLVPEYATMSRRPGIGSDWYRKFPGDVYPSDFLIIDGAKSPVPKFFNQIKEKEEPDEYRRIRVKRKKTARRKAANNTPERLKVREKIQQLKARKLKREIEEIQ